MKKSWKVIIVIVLIAILLGAVCIGVGLLTGADFPRIVSILDNRYHVKVYYEYGIDLFNAIMEAV